MWWVIKFWFQRGVLLWGGLTFWRGLQGIFGENRKLHNCGIIISNMLQRLQYALRFIRGHCRTQTYFRIVELAWAPKNWTQIFLEEGLKKDLILSYEVHFKPISGIYPSSFTNVHFWTKTEFSNVLNFMWVFQSAVRSATGS